MAVRNGQPDSVLGGLYPFQDRYVQLDDGVTMHYVEMGSAGWRRPTFLLLHGNPTWSFLYRDWIAPLSRIGRVVAVDHVGYGRSDHPVDPKYHTLERHIRNLQEFAAKTGLKRVVPVVQDLGGPIGLGYATRQPEDMRGLVVLNTWAFTRRAPLKLPLWYKATRARGVGEWLYGRRSLAVESYLPKLLQRRPSDAVMAGYRHPFPTVGSRTAMVQAPRMVPDRPDHPDWATLDAVERGLPGLDVPVQILWGRRDPAFSQKYAHAFKDALPQAQAPVVFDDAGHWLQEDIPAQLLPRVAAFGEAL